MCTGTRGWAKPQGGLRAVVKTLGLLLLLLNLQTLSFSLALRLKHSTRTQLWVNKHLKSDSWRKGKIKTECFLPTLMGTKRMDPYWETRSGPFMGGWWAKFPFRPYISSLSHSTGVFCFPQGGQQVKEGPALVPGSPGMQEGQRASHCPSGASRGEGVPWFQREIRGSRTLVVSYGKAGGRRDRGDT